MTPRRPNRSWPSSAPRMSPTFTPWRGSCSWNYLRGLRTLLETRLIRVLRGAVMSCPPTKPDVEFEDRLRFETLLTELSAHFIGATAETIDSEIVNAQRQIVEALDLDRSMLARLEGDHFVVTHSWSLPSVPSFPGYTLRDLPWLSA